MRNLGWLWSNPDLLGNEFYTKSAFKSYFFILDFVLLLVTTALNIFVLTKYWALLSSFSHFWLVVNAAALISLWFLAVRYRRRLQELHTMGGAIGSQAGSPLETALRVAATVMHMGLFYGFLLLAGLLNLMANILHGRG
ncbi:MAG: hypothetical protein WBE20_10290 [Candidatus Acidiferrales bacterium]